MELDERDEHATTQPLSPEEQCHACFVALFLACEKEVFRYICALPPIPMDAQDLLQQSALALRRKFDEHDPSKPFTPWACRFAALLLLN